MKAINLKTEHLTDPLGIDVIRPLLTWNCTEGITQTAYEITAQCGGAEIWNTGKVSSSQMYAQFGADTAPRQRITWRIRLWDEADSPGEWSEASFEMGLTGACWKAQWINPELTCDPKLHKPASYLRKSFELSSLGRGRLYITCHGLYEAWINGRRAGDFVLAPGSYDYSKRLAYQTYDVSDLLRLGSNEVRVILGDGWYRSVSGVDGDRNLYGTDVALLMQLEVDGSIVCVSDESWEATQEGPIRENDMQQGEVVDARLDASTGYHAVKTEDFGFDTLICSNCVPIREKEHFSGKLLTTPNGETVIDFGQNLAGYVQFRLKAHAGDTIVLTHGETLDENGNFTQENFQDRKRHKEGGTNQRVTYTCREGENVYKPKFTIWGFRYAKVETGIDLRDAEFTSIAVYSDMAETGSFTCGNPLVNRLVQNTLWSMKSNFCDVPTDCPTRERAAWTGDMGVFVETGLYLMDSYPVIRKWLAECRLAQSPDGKIANIAPRNNNPSFFSGLLAGSVGWGDACILVPYALYQATGDVRILEENYGMMCAWYAFLEERAKKKPMNPVKLLKRNPYRRFTIETGIDYGEWCEPDVDSTSAMRTPQGKIATAYFARSGFLLSEIAGILGKREDAQRFAGVAGNARKAFRFLATENGSIHSDRQAEYVRAISFDLLSGEEKQQAADDLAALVEKCGYHLNTGFLSTPELCPVLARYGHIDTAYRLLLQESMPSWLYEVSKGATTIWENWDGIDAQGRVKASLNHYSYGAVCGWLFGGVCGIQLRGGKLTISPQPSKELGCARARWDSPVGTVESKWHYNGNRVILEVVIPSNVTAEIRLPDGGAFHAQQGRHVFSYAEESDGHIGQTNC